MVVNHQSILDIPLIYQLCLNFRWIAKAELIVVPVLGWVIRMNGHIIVKRGDRDSALQMAEQCKKKLGKGIPVCFFPEGTRSVNGALGSFKQGAFILAKETGIPIQPVLIYGAVEALSKKRKVFKTRQHFRICMLRPIENDRMGRLTVEELTAYTHSIMQKELEHYSFSK